MSYAHHHHHHHYDIVDLGSFPIVNGPISVPADWQAVTPQDINDAGLVVGWEYSQYGPGGPNGPAVTNEYWQAFSHSEHGGIIQLNQVIPELAQYGDASGVNAAGSIAVTVDWSGGAGQYQPGRIVADKLELLALLPYPYDAKPANYFTGKINSCGHVVGTAISSLGNASVPFVGDPKAIKSLGNLPGGNQGGAFGINDREEIVGTSSSGSTAKLAFLYSERHGLQDLNTLVTSGGNGWLLQQGNAVNALGEIVGVGEYNGVSPMAFHFAHGAVRNLGTLPDGLNSCANDISDRGEVVGYVNTSDPSKNPRACLFPNDTAVDLNDLIDRDSGWALQQAAAVNNAGQIVGFGTHARCPGQLRGFRLTPRW